MIGESIFDILIFRMFDSMSFSIFNILVKIFRAYQALDPNSMNLIPITLWAQLLFIGLSS